MLRRERMKKENAAMGDGVRGWQGRGGGKGEEGGGVQPEAKRRGRRGRTARGRAKRRGRATESKGECERQKTARQGRR